MRKTALNGFDCGLYRHEFVAKISSAGTGRRRSGNGIFAADEPVISLLVRLEAEVQFRARRQGGSLRLSAYKALSTKLSVLEEETPIAVRPLSSLLLETALRQHRESGVHCRSLDRLHLAAMEELEITRLMTHDARQAEAARAQGFRVTTP